MTLTKLRSKKELRSKISKIKEEQHINKILDGTDNIIFLKRLDGGIIHINRQFFNLFPEYGSIKEFTQQHNSIFELFDNDDPNYIDGNYFEDNIYELLNQQISHKVKITRQERTLFFRATMKAVSLEKNKEEFVITLSDITQLEHEMQKNIQQERILQQQAKMASMGEMIGNIAHQWRQPLNTLSTLNTLLFLNYEENDSLSPKQMEDFKKRSNFLIQKMSTTIDDFRNFFLPKAKNKSSFKLKSAIEQTIGFMQDTYIEHHIQLVQDINSEIHITSYQNELEQVLLNLFNNAKDAHISNKTINPKVIVRLIKEGSHSSITIEDNAGGIDPKIIDKVFEPYFSTKFENQGTGIGLYMSKMIIEESIEGQLTIENHNEGVLATINFTKKPSFRQDKAPLSRASMKEVCSGCHYRESYKKNQK
ncbi:MAG: Putative two-component sensor histidine kinase [uncultured Sulfurovum sp.]|uniref:histidine kinase n=1 Tax=uncultured Sulfurovum sp. TaxID=269237 RepID=A0A6S6SJ47_9BACT|nr:MAG: Putative two-component sensor histidine kinase [uncultured Sulfurovum sp.]